METIMHTGRMIEVVQKEVERRGIKRIFEFARRSPGTRLIISRDDLILLTKEYRHETNGFDYRLPGGKVFDSLLEYHAARASGADIGESVMQAAIKEAREETGIIVETMHLFHKSICGATVVWDLFYYVVDQFTQGEQELEPGEDITVEFINREQVRKMCMDGSIGEERSALVLLRYLNSL